jgi:hypothetical protein
MANAAHLARLTHGGEGWNAWRDNDRGVPPDLRGYRDDGGASL